MSKILSSRNFKNMTSGFNLVASTLSISVWAKVKEAAKNLGDNIKNKVTDVLENYKPKVLDALNNVKKVVIDGVKQIVVEFNNGVVKILTDGQTATSDGNLYAFDDTHYEAYVVIDDSPVQGYAFGDGKELKKRTNKVLLRKPAYFWFLIKLLILV